MIHMLHDAVIVTLFVFPPHPKRKNLHDLKETKEDKKLSMHACLKISMQ
jgi:hypothetical protein